MSNDRVPTPETPDEPLFGIRSLGWGLAANVVWIFAVAVANEVSIEAAIPLLLASGIGFYKTWR